MSARFEGQVAVITGAARGIGRAAALSFAQEGAAVALIDQHADELEALAAEVTSAGGEAIFTAGDVRDPATIDNLAIRATGELGPISVLLNNAGVHYAAPLEDHSVEDFERVLGVNCVAQFVTIKRIVPQMKLGGRGSIVNISSVNAHEGIATFTGYCASKSAVLGLTRAIAAEVGPTIRCNAVCPGAVATPLLEGAVAALPDDERRAAIDAFTRNQILKRVAQPDEIIRLVLFLASDEASFMTGEIVNIDGGWTAFSDATP